MSFEEAFQVDCSELDSLLDIDSVKALNLMVTEPSRFEEYYDKYGFEDKKSLKQLIEMLTEASAEYSGNHENDSYGESQIGTLESLMETELYYKCREESDFIELMSEIMFRITAGHPFEEGNKRTAFLAGSLFALNYQGLMLELEKQAIPVLDEDLLDTLEDIADNEDMNPEDISDVIRKRMTEKFRQAYDS